MTNYITDNKLFSLIFFHRRSENRRGAPIRAALTWALLEESRIYAEMRFNQNYRVTSRPLRLNVQTMISKFFKRQGKSPYYFLDACPIDNSNFTVRGTTPLLPVNPIWKEEKNGVFDVGVLIEVQTLACSPDMFTLGKCWWPLTSSHISRCLNVSVRNY